MTDIQTQTEIGALLHGLYALIEERKQTRPAGSYTTYLFDKGLDKILKKVGEESAEAIIAAKNLNNSELALEISDLLYHLVVLMVERGMTWDDISAELQHRSGKPADPKYSEQLTVDK